jgi:hypothetical protein
LIFLFLAQLEPFWVAQVAPFYPELGISLAIGYNNENFYDFILGFSVKGGLMNNSSTMEALKIQTIKYIITTPSTTVQAVTEKSAYDISEYSNNNGFICANFDIGDNPIGDRLYWLIQGKLKVDESLKPTQSLGLGIYVTKDNTPLQVIGGIQFKISDLTENRTNKSLSERLILNFSTSISFE